MSGAEAITITKKFSDEQPFARLRELDEQLSQIVQQYSASQYIDEWFFHLPWPAWLKTPEGLMVALNPAYTEHYSITVGEYVGTMGDLPWGESTGVMFKGNDEEVARTGKAGVYSERVHNPKTGETENLLVCKFPCYAAGEFIGVGGFCIYLPL